MGSRPPESLKQVDVLLVAIALSARNHLVWEPGQPEGENKWALPTVPAFEASEVDAVEAWVRDGGSLLLLAGHMPLPGAAEEAGRAVRRAVPERLCLPNRPRLREVMTGMPPKKDAKVFSLADHPILAGRAPRERVSKFEGSAGIQAFLPRLGGNARPLLGLEEPWVLLLPEVPVRGQNGASEWERD